MSTLWHKENIVSSTAATITKSLNNVVTEHDVVGKSSYSRNIHILSHKGNQFSFLFLHKYYKLVFFQDPSTTSCSVVFSLHSHMNTIRFHFRL